MATNLIESIREEFLAFVGAFSGMLNSATALGKGKAGRAAFAVRFSRAFVDWKLADKDKTFIAFVRMLDSSVPEARDAYRVHAAYMAADYLWRKGKPALRQELEAKGSKASATDKAALKAIEPKAKASNGKASKPGVKADITGLLKALQGMDVGADQLQRALETFSGYKPEVITALCGMYRKLQRVAA